LYNTLQLELAVCPLAAVEPEEDVCFSEFLPLTFILSELTFKLSSAEPWHVSILQHGGVVSLGKLTGGGDGERLGRGLLPEVRLADPPPPLHVDYLYLDKFFSADSILYCCGSERSRVGRRLGGGCALVKSRCTPLVRGVCQLRRDTWRRGIYLAASRTGLQLALYIAGALFHECFNTCQGVGKEGGNIRHALCM